MLDLLLAWFINSDTWIKNMKNNIKYEQVISENASVKQDWSNGKW